VPELLAEFSPSGYMTDTQLSRLTWIPCYSSFFHRQHTRSRPSRTPGCWARPVARACPRPGAWREPCGRGCGQEDAGGAGPARRCGEADDQDAGAPPVPASLDGQSAGPPCGGRQRALGARPWDHRVHGWGMAEAARRLGLGHAGVQRGQSVIGTVPCEGPHAEGLQKTGRQKDTSARPITDLPS
jgi:hypothetical protein